MIVKLTCKNNDFLKNKMQNDLIPYRKEFGNVKHVPDVFTL